jgi:hypothetical protein
MGEGDEHKKERNGLRSGDVCLVGWWGRSKKKGRGDTWPVGGGEKKKKKKEVWCTWLVGKKGKKKEKKIIM